MPHPPVNLFPLNKTVELILLLFIFIMIISSNNIVVFIIDLPVP